MNVREAIDYLKGVGYQASAFSSFEPYYEDGTDYKKSVDVLEAAIQEREERSKGCEYCSHEGFLQDSEDMEIALYNHTDGEVYDVYPSFCPVCGRPLKGD